MRYAEKYGVSRASRKYNKSRSCIYFWKQRWDGSAVSLACQSRRPHSHPNQHTEAERKLIRDMRRRNPSLGMIELRHRLRLRGYTRCPESLFRVMRKMGLFPAEKPKNRMCPDRKQLRVYHRFSGSKRDLPTLFEKTAAELGIRHKPIRPYAQRHNGKVERSHRKEQKHFYSCHTFYFLDDFAKQLAVHNRRSNNLPIRPLHWLSPNEFTVQFV